MEMQWQSPPPPPIPPQAPFGPPRPPRRKSWLPAAILGAATVLAAGLIGGALILKSRDDGMSTCAAWKETRLTLRAIPALPEGWNFNTPNIDTAIKNQNAPVGVALDLFEPKIKAEPADVAQAARDYIDARRKQIQALADRSYVPADGAAVDTALARLNQLCGIPGRGLSI